MIGRTLSCVAAAALMSGAAPALAADSPAEAQSAYAIERFYDARGDKPLWLRGDNGRQAALHLVELLRRSDVEGFDRGPGLAVRIADALDEARSGDPAAVDKAERLLSSAWTQYVQALSWPATGVIYGDQSLVPQIPGNGDILRQAANAPSLREHVEQVAGVNPIYAALRDSAWTAKASGDRDLLARLVTNMERARALPSAGRFVLVDIASARLWMYEDGQVRDSMKVVVGKPDQQTPMVVSSVRHAVLNPYWHVPVDMVRTLIAPKVLREGETYLRANGYQLVSDYGEDPELLSPDAVDWKAVAEGRAEARVRQLPGTGNAMGAMKIMFSNRSGIYLHDTPDKALFDKAQRNFSGGCIRLEDAPRLARWLLGEEPAAASARPEQRVELPSPVPIHVTYLTVQPDGNGGLAFASDVYGLDDGAGAMLAAR